MKRKKTLVFFLVFSLALMLFGCSPNGLSGPPSLVNTITLDLSSTADVEINYLAEDVSITFGEADEFVLYEYMNSNEPRLFAAVEPAGRSLTITHGYRNNIVGLRSYIEVVVPKSYSGSLSVYTASGSLSFSGGGAALAALDLVTLSGSIAADSFTAIGEASFDTASGRIDINGVTAGELAAVSLSGSVDANDITAQEISLESASGRITADNCSGYLELSSMSGSVKVTQLSGGGSFASTSGSVDVSVSEFTKDIEAESTSGSVHISVPRTSAFHFSASSISGRISASFTGLSATSSGSLSGDVGSNPTLSISAETVSGSVTAGYL